MGLRLLYLSDDSRVPEAVERFLAGDPENTLERIDTPAETVQALDRGIADLLLIDTDQDFRAAARLCERLKTDPFNSVVPIVCYSREHRVEEIASAFESGADEFLSETHTVREQLLRLTMVLQRAARDVAVHPSTMLPGTKIIQHEISQRIGREEPFAVCYADIDSFKEFNDKHSYFRGDRVIWIVSLILRDIVRRLSDRGFVGHIGGDDFIYTVPIEDVERVAKAIIETFDTLMMLQYEEDDRTRGFYLAEDRQGQMRQIPLMTLSIGVVTNLRRDLAHPAKVSELASEMKSYAKTFRGSNFVVDRRGERTGSNGEQ